VRSVASCRFDVNLTNYFFHFAVNHKESFVDYRVGVDVPGKYKLVLNSDEKRFGGHDRIQMDSEFFTTDFEWNGRRNYLQVSLTGCR